MGSELLPSLKKTWSWPKRKLRARDSGLSMPTGRGNSEVDEVKKTIQSIAQFETKWL
jgi:hypothetical protein